MTNRRTSLGVSIERQKRAHKHLMEQYAERKKRSLKVSKNDTLRERNARNAENKAPNLRKPPHVSMHVYQELYNKAEALLIALNGMSQCCSKAGVDFPFKEHQALWQFMYADYKA